MVDPGSAGLPRKASEAFGAHPSRDVAQATIGRVDIVVLGIPEPAEAGIHVSRRWGTGGLISRFFRQNIMAVRKTRAASCNSGSAHVAMPLCKPSFR